MRGMIVFPSRGTLSYCDHDIQRFRAFSPSVLRS